MKSSWILVPFHYNEEYSRAITVMDPAANNIDPIKHVKRIQKIGKKLKKPWNYSMNNGMTMFMIGLVYFQAMFKRK
jgi:hypothetical protein